MTAFPSRPLKTLPELQRDVVAAFRPLTKSAEAIRLEEATVLVTETPVAHGLGHKPSNVFFSQTSTGGPIFENKPPDQNNVFLRSVSGTVTVRVTVWP